MKEKENVVRGAAGGPRGGLKSPKVAPETVLAKNTEIIKKIVGAVRRYVASGNVGVTVCIDDDANISEWATGFGGRPILYCAKDEFEITVYFRVPNYFISRYEVASAIAEALSEAIAIESWVREK